MFQWQYTCKWIGHGKSMQTNPNEHYNLVNKRTNNTQTNKTVERGRSGGVGWGAVHRKPSARKNPYLNSDIQRLYLGLIVFCMQGLERPYALPGWSLQQAAMFHVLWWGRMFWGGIPCAAATLLPPPRSQRLEQLRTQANDAQLRTEPAVPLQDGHVLAARYG